MGDKYMAYESVRNLNRLEHLLKCDARFQVRQNGANDIVTSDQLMKNYTLADVMNQIHKRYLKTVPPL